METISGRVYNPKDKNGKFIFPEQVYYGVDPEKISLALSGGGSRAFTTSMATIRFLEHMNLIDKISYISTVSGSNWFIGPYIFREMNLGKYRNPQNITMARLENDNIGYAADVCIDTQIMKKLKECRNIHIKGDKIWSYINGQCFLEKYGLNGKPIVNDLKRAEFFYNNNYLECEVPLKGRPFWLSNSSVLCDKAPVFLTSTPLYSGIPSRIFAKNNIIGGIFIETPLLDSFNPRIKLKKPKSLINFVPKRLFTINDMIGCSSAAFTFPIEELQEKVYKNLGINLNKLENLNPLINYYDVDGKKDVDIVTTDGYRVDNLGIISLLARGSKKILCMSANLDISSSLHNSNLLPLFGLWSSHLDSLNSNTSELNDLSQVFHKSDWESVKEQIERRISEGGPVYLHKKLKVLKNKRLSVSGGYEVELLIYFLYPSVEYISQLPLDVQEEIVKHNGKLNNFPNYKTLFQNEDHICSYTREQINLLSYYVQWCLNRTKDKLIEFFNGSDDSDDSDGTVDSDETVDSDDSDDSDFTINTVQSEL